jgi:hypothetical protein
VLKSAVAVAGARREPSLILLDAKPNASSDQLSSVPKSGKKVYK